MNSKVKMQVQIVPSTENLSRDDLARDTRDTLSTDTLSLRVFQADHTIGTLLQKSLCEDERVTFAGYCCPHPLDPFVLLRVRTVPGEQSFMAVRRAVTDLRAEASLLEQEFQREVAKQSFR
jgi:DNA-directed RNA polymerase subunit L